MRDLPPGWATDLAIQRLSGAEVTDRGDHLVLRSPAVPDHHWGNCVLVVDPGAVDDADRWVGVFAAQFPDARWLAVGLPRMPADVAAWTAHDLELTEDEALTTRRAPRAEPAPAGYAVRFLATDDDWEQHVAREVAENLAEPLYEPVRHEAFVRSRTAAQRALCEQGHAAWVGAFHAGTLVADLGIVLCDTGSGLDARYQAVGTDAAHRRRGIAGHLLGVAAAWADARGATRWVIVTESTNPAGRVYRRVGFEPVLGGVQAYRRPPFEWS